VIDGANSLLVDIISAAGQMSGPHRQQNEERSLQMIEEGASLPACALFFLD
jgi:hypothetical protein